MKATPLFNSLFERVKRLFSGEPEKVIAAENYCEHHHLSDYYCTKEEIFT